MATVALLRAVNLGGRNKVPMAELRAALEERGYAGVATFIASGNVLFPAKSPSAGELEALIAERFGVSTVAVYRTAAQLRKLTEAQPFGDESYVAFLGGKAARAGWEALSEDDTPWVRVGSDLVVHYRDGVQRARLNVARIERLLGVPATLRNWRTTTKLAELATR